MVKLFYVIISFLIANISLAQTYGDALKTLDIIGAGILKRENPSLTGAGITVAVIDTGVYAFHPSLFGKIDRHGYNFETNSNRFIDDHGHGTHVAATIAGEVFGVSPGVKILPIKVNKDNSGSVNLQHLIKSIRYAVDRGAKVINLSIAGRLEFQKVSILLIEESIKYAHSKGVMIVVAAGNDGLDITDTPLYPAIINQPNVLTVCATTDNNNLASFSNFSKTHVDLCAPGVDIASADYKYRKGNDKFLIFKSGTSMAAPLVSGSIALLFEAFPKLSISQIRSAIMNSAKFNGGRNTWLKHTSVSGGVLDVYTAYLELKRINNNLLSQP